MSETKVFKNIEELPVVVAESPTHSTATIQVRGTESVVVVVDNRDEAQRATDGDDLGLVYKPGDSIQFSGFDGEVRVHQLSKVSQNTAEVVVARS